MTTEKVKKIRTPKGSESITAGALKLTLKEKVALVNELKASIDAELKEIEDTAKAARETVNGFK